MISGYELRGCLGANAAQLLRCSSYTSKVHISTHECHLWVHFWTLTPVNSNLSKGGTRGNKMHRREPERGDTTLTQIGCDKNTITISCSHGDVQDSPWSPVQGKISLDETSAHAHVRARQCLNLAFCKWPKHTGKRENIQLSAHNYAILQKKLFFKEQIIHLNWWGHLHLYL